MDTARRAAAELGTETVIIKKTSPEYLDETDPPPCPSVLLDGRIIVRDGTISFSEIREIVRSREER